MYYLRCTRCGHYNELKTEYLTFCKNCNKVLENNYPDWLRKNPGKTFEEYRQAYAVTDPLPAQEAAARPRHRLNYKFWIGFFLTFVLFYVVGQFAGDKIVAFIRTPSIDKTMMAIAGELNKSCPIMVDNATRLDNSIALPDKVFQYNYTLVSLVKDSVNTDEIKKILEPRIINQVKTDPQMKFVRDHKVTVNYSYRDRTGVNLFTISVSPEQYK